MLGTQPRIIGLKKKSKTKQIYDYQDKQEFANVKQQIQLTSHAFSNFLIRKPNKGI